MWPRARRAACGLGYVLLALCLSSGQPTSPPSTLPPGSVVLFQEDYDALVEAGVQAQNELRNSSGTIKNLSDVVASNSTTIENSSTVIANNSSTIAAQSKALENSSTVIAEQARHLTRLSNVCVVLGSAAVVEAVLFILALIF